MGLPGESGTAICKGLKLGPTAPPPYAPGTSLRWADAGGWDGAPRPPNQQSSVLTGTGVGSEDPGQGAHRPRVPALPQALQLGELAGRTDESTEILFADKTGES